MLTIVWYSSAKTMTENLNAIFPIEGLIPGWLILSFSVISIIVLVLALLYMVSKIFSVPTLDRKIREEFFQLGATIIILFLLVLLNATGGIFVNNNTSINDTLSKMSGYYILGTNNEGVNPFVMSYVYLISSLDCLKKDFKESVDYVNSQETWLMFGVSGTVVSVNVPIPIRTILVGLNLWDKVLDKYVSAEEVMWLSLAAYFQINLLQWIEASMFSIYLPLGILLRSIPFTRGGGAAIMAIAITTYIFYPFFLSMFFYNGPQLPSSCNVEFDYEKAEIPKEQKKCPLDPTAVSSLIEKAGESNKEETFKLPVLDVSGLNRVKTYTYYYPFLTMLICVIIVRAIAQILGGNISDIGRGMVRVI